MHYRGRVTEEQASPVAGNGPVTRGRLQIGVAERRAGKRRDLVAKSLEVSAALRFCARSLRCLLLGLGLKCVVLFPRCVTVRITCER
jgi:hypothetical protein